MSSHAASGPRLSPVGGLRRLAGRAAHRDGVMVAAVVVLALLAAMALLGPWLAPESASRVDLGAAFQGPSAAHPLGTDASGRDILGRLLAGARTAMVGALLATLLATTVGTAIAIASAWRGGRADALASRSLDVLFAFPGLLLAILAVAVFGPGLTAPVIALAIAYVPYVARIVRSSALRQRSMEYIAACRLQGLSGWAICRRHLLPNVQRVVYVQGAVTFSYAMVDLAAINFLGLGVQAPQADWGVMVASGQSSILRGRPEEALFASAMIVLAVVSVNLLAERLGNGGGRERQR
jgi:peptide/nickel transport system permease protein